ncbi:uncharacterized protein LOC119678387 isoform X2 [Teleopsis dalmanni]|uniref:uncharacterized protein LOC119678387 isoform X2 n=1 Tax=Teleopsis dalmanni TaxID=139649 RepID=UPI0018CCCCF0|nr:uncharacterized protein LOC119678387 isoform X2 [Teleopsis dalmanni]
MAFYRTKVDEEENEMERKYDIHEFDSTTYINSIPRTYADPLYVGTRLGEELSDFFSQDNDGYKSTTSSTTVDAKAQQNIKSRNEFIPPKSRGLSSRPLHITMKSRIKSFEKTKDLSPRKPPRLYNTKIKSTIISRNIEDYIDPMALTPPTPPDTIMNPGIKSRTINRSVIPTPISPSSSVCTTSQSDQKLLNSIGNMNSMLESPSRTSNTKAQPDIKSPHLTSPPTNEPTFGKMPTTYVRRLRNKSTDAITRDTDIGSNSKSLSSARSAKLQSDIKSPHLIACGRASLTAASEVVSSPHYGNKLSGTRTLDLIESNAKVSNPDTLPGLLHTPEQSDNKTFDFIAHVKSITNDGSVTSVYPTSRSDSKETGRTETQDLDSLDIPSLDLRSTDGQSTSAKFGATFTIHRINAEEAFQNWLKAKKTQKEKEIKLKLKADAKKREKEELRKVESHVKVQQWEERKRIEKAAEIAKRKLVLEKTQTSKLTIKKTESNLKVMEWEYTKMQLAVEKKQMQKAELELKKAQEEMRREQANEAWNKWITKAKDKPKPVPLNRGLDSLRGSLSQTYINPNEWKT